MELREDQYIIAPGQDELGRKSLVGLIVNAIKAKVQKPHGPLTIGIYGAWGEGKTTTMRMVMHDLELSSVSCLWFNPWTFSGEKRMMNEFFSALASVSFPNSDYAEILTSYRDAYLHADGMGNNPVLTDYQASMAKYFPFDVSDLECVKRKISERLEMIDKHLVVFIDDVDRLDTEEVQTIFKMIRQVVDFNNIIYVIGLDPDVVSQQLGIQYGESQQSRGRSYLEKIVNIPIVLPAVQDERLLDLMRKEIVGVWRDNNIEGIEKDADKVVNILLPVMNTKRAIDRFANQLGFIVPTIGVETEFVDLCLVESLKYLDEKGWAEVYHQRKGLLKEGILLPTDKERDAEEKRIYDDAVSKVVAHYPEKWKAYVKGVLEEHLFTKIHTYYTNNLSRCINNSKYFKQYFVVGIPDDTIPRANALEFAELLQQDTSKAIEWINEKLKTYRSSEVDRSACLALDIINAEKSSEVASKLIEVLAFSNLAENFGFYTIDNPSFTDGTIYAYIIPNYLVIRTSEGGRILDIEKEVEVLAKVFKDAPLNFCMTLFAGVFDHDNTRPVGNENGLFDIIKKRVLEKGEKAIFDYSYPIKTRFFLEWKESNLSEYTEFWRKVLRQNDFDLGYIIKHWLTAVSPQHQLTEIGVLTSILSPVISEMQENLSRSAYKEDKLVKLFVWNYKPILEQIIESKKLDIKKIMEKIDICETVIPGENEKKVKITILRAAVPVGDVNTVNAMMDAAVNEYVQSKGHNTFTEVHRDTPNIRIIINDFNDIDFKPYSGEHL